MTSAQPQYWISPEDYLASENDRAEGTRHEVEIHRRTEGWRVEGMGDGDVLALTSIGVEVPVETLYA